AFFLVEIETAAGKSRHGLEILAIERPFVAPVEPIDEGDRAVLGRLLLGLPEPRNIVVDLALRRYLIELDGTLAPVADRFHPQARPALVLGLEIEGGRSATPALPQAHG